MSPPESHQGDPEIKPFDIVQIRSAVLLSRRKETRSTPKDLVRIGWPNQFMVLEVFTAEDKVCLRLDPCCQWMRHLESGDVLCSGHPAEHFTKVAEAASPHPDDRYCLARWPWGELFSLQYSADPNNPSLTGSVAGSPPVTVFGELAKLIADGIRAKGIL